MEKTLREKIVAKLAKIKVVLAEDENTEEVTLEDVRTVDGTLLRVEPALEVGATIQVIGEDAELIDAPDGSHELEDGSVINVEGGIIVEVIAVEVPAEEEMNEELPEVPAPKGLDVEALTNDVMNKLNEAIVNKIAGLKFEETIAELKSENAALKETILDVVTEVEKFAAQEKAKPTKEHRNPFAKQESKLDFSKLLRK